MVDIAVRRERKRGELYVIDFEESDIDVPRDAHNASRNDVGACGEDGLQRAVYRSLGDHDLNALRSGDHVRIRDDVSGWIDHKSRADGALPSNDRRCAAAFAGLNRAVARNQNLHHAGRDFLDQGVDRLIEFAQGIVVPPLGRVGCAIECRKESQKCSGKHRSGKRAAINHGSLTGSAFEDITGSVPAPKAHPKGVAVTREGTTLRGWKWLAGHDGCILRCLRVSKIVKINPSFC